MVATAIRGHSVGCQTDNAKSEHPGNCLRPVNVPGHFGTSDDCGTYSVDGKSAGESAPARASTEGTVWGRASPQQHRSHSFWPTVVYLTTDAVPSGTTAPPRPART